MIGPLFDELTLSEFGDMNVASLLDRCEVYRRVYIDGPGGERRELEPVLVKTVDCRVAPFVPEGEQDVGGQQDVPYGRWVVTFAVREDIRIDHRLRVTSYAHNMVKWLEVRGFSKPRTFASQLRAYCHEVPGYELLAQTVLVSPLLLATFNAPNGTKLENYVSDTGQPWVKQVIGDAEILDGRMHALSSTSTNNYFARPGASDGRFEVDLPNPGAFSGVTFRIGTDIQDFWLFLSSGPLAAPDGYLLFRIENNASFLVANGPAVWPTPATLGVDVVDDVISIDINGVPVIVNMVNPYQVEGDGFGVYLQSGQKVDEVRFKKAESLSSALITDGLTNDWNPSVGQGGGTLYDMVGNINAKFGIRAGTTAPTWQLDPPMIRFDKTLLQQAQTQVPVPLGAVTTIQAVIQTRIRPNAASLMTWFHNSSAANNGRKIAQKIPTDPAPGWRVWRNNAAVGADDNVAPVDGGTYLITMVDDGEFLSFYVGRRLVWKTSVVASGAYVDGGIIVFGGNALALTEPADGGMGRSLLYRDTAFTPSNVYQNWRALKKIYPALL